MTGDSGEGWQRLLRRTSLSTGLLAQFPEEESLWRDKRGPVRGAVDGILGLSVARTITRS
ncbi:hypothetical protein SAMN04487913_11941 [Arthrobacter sp. ok362]|nr:hypothetical protein SAMN04487913_11941 [Arthrobacter sp. ok362]